MYSTTIKPKVDIMFDDLREKVATIVSDASTSTEAVTTATKLVSSELATRSKSILSDIHVINKKLGSNRPRKRRSASNKSSSSNGNKNREEKERAEEIFDKFKHGGKLSTEELLLLQKYNIN